jgi:hypothetical protein
VHSVAHSLQMLSMHTELLQPFCSSHVGSPSKCPSLQHVHHYPHCIGVRRVFAFFAASTLHWPSTMASYIGGISRLLERAISTCEAFASAVSAAAVCQYCMEGTPPAIWLLPEGMLICMDFCE